MFHDLHKHSHRDGKRSNGVLIARYTAQEDSAAQETALLPLLHVYKKSMKPIN
jgi:hypothetical protein